MTQTYKFAGKTFTVGDNKLYESAINCPLKPHESYAIAVILQTEEGSINSEIKIAKTPSFHIGDVPKRYIEVWIITIAICLIVAGVGYYLYRRCEQSFNTPMENLLLTFAMVCVCDRKMKVSLTNVVPQEEMAVARNSLIPENKELSNSNRILTVTPGASHKEHLSRFNTPHNSPFTHDRCEDVCSPVEVKNFEDYVKQAIDSRLLDKQFNVNLPLFKFIFQMLPAVSLRRSLNFSFLGRRYPEDRRNHGITASYRRISRRIVTETL